MWPSADSGFENRSFCDIPLECGTLDAQSRSNGVSRVSSILSRTCAVIALALATTNALAASADFTAESLAKKPTANWPTNGGNLANQRYSPLAQINTSNVHNLKAVWRAHLNGSGVGPPYSGEAQPIVYDGVVYMITGADDVFAVSVESGESLWSYEANLDRAISTVCCGWTSRGVAINGDRVFLGRLDGTLVALDRHTGDEVWSTQVERWQEGYTITSAPLYYDGMVITGMSGAELATRGRVKAYDADTGAHVWTFYTVPGPGEFGHDTWPENSNAWQTGGATVWQTPAVDPDLGLLYFSTGNPGPDFTGSVRAGDNLFSASIVALDVKTGKYRWHFQQVHHDIWDYDAPSPVVLFDIERDGVTRHAIAEVGKTGWVYILDRVTGKPLVGIEERPVPQEPRQLTSPTQPYPIGDAVIPHSIDIAGFGEKLVNQGRIFTPFWDQPVSVKPGALGGTNWPPSSYDPRLQQLFVCATDSIGRFTGGNEEPGEAGQSFIGGEYGTSEIETTGIFAAMDMHSNKIVWRQRWKDMCYSGSVATAGNLVFTGRSDGRFVAMDSRTGESLWEFQTGAGVNAPASVFEHNGDQHIVVYSAGNLFARSTPGDSVWLFSLKGTVDQEESPLNTQMADVDISAGDATAGAEVYARSCAGCHGTSGEGGHGGGPSITRPMEPGYLISIITNGGATMPALGVPGFTNPLSTDNIRDVTVYMMQRLATSD
jgi:alcohol dehydrogenase (cytochrome c)